MRVLSSFARDDGGAAAVELAIIVPVIAGLAMLSLEVWKIGVEQRQAAAALDVAAGYYMAGGLSDTAAAQAARDAWDDAPPNAAVTYVRSARCGAQSVALTALCVGERAPAVYVTLTASGGAVAADARVRATRMIRVR